jgi:phosphate:Na+ symporter
MPNGHAKRGRNCRFPRTSAIPPNETPGGTPQLTAFFDTTGANANDPGEQLTRSAAEHLDGLERCSNNLSDLLPSHRRATRKPDASGELTATGAIAHVDAMRRPDRLAHHASQAAAHLAHIVAQD